MHSYIGAYSFIFTFGVGAKGGLGKTKLFWDGGLSKTQTEGMKRLARYFTPRETHLCPRHPDWLRLCSLLSCLYLETIRYILFFCDTVYIRSDDCLWTIQCTSVHYVQCESKV